MTFLLPKDYHSIIEFAIDIKEEDIQHYFFNQYEQHKSTNTNFVNKLRETISELESRFNLLIDRYNSDWEKAEIEFNNNDNEIVKRKIIDWSNHSFFYLNGILNFHFPPAWLNTNYRIFTPNKYKEIKSGFDEFIELHIEEKEIEEIQKIELPKKIKWKGTPAQFCYIVDLLIHKGYIEQPTPKGERSAKILLEHFEIENHNPSIESLGKMLHKDIDQIKNIDHRKLFQKIPNRNDLDK